MKKFFSYSLILLAFSVFFVSCSDDEDIESGGDTTLESYHSYKDVLMTQVVNGVENLTLENLNDNLAYTTTISFGEKEINWPNPTFEQSFDKYLEVNESSIVVKDSEGNPLSNYELVLKDNTVRIHFKAEAGGRFDYLNGKTYTITINAKMKRLSYSELASLSGKGLSTISYFYGTSILVNAKSNKAVTLFENVKLAGDPRNNEYKYKLNVVYFVPKGVAENEFYQERISEILFMHQLWTCEWMKKWGYEEKSYGLPLLDNGLVDIIVVKGANEQSYYKTTVPTQGGEFIRKEVTEYFESNNIKFNSEHTLVITPINEIFPAGGGSAGAPVPFFGSNKWCFALDYPTMSQNHLKETGNPEVDKASGWIGGMLHELGHALNLYHIGASLEQESLYGPPLMGSGSYAYGKGKMFFHEASAATLNNCQVSSFEEKTFYDKTTANIKITSIKAEGDKCTVKGTFDSDKKVTGIIVRFYDSAERNLQNDGNYNSVGFLLTPKADNTFERTFTVAELENKSFSEFKIGVVALIENGNIVSDAASDKLKINGKAIERITLDRANWVVKTSHALPQDGKIKNALENLVDGDALSGLYIVKPGKTFGGVTVLPTDRVHIEIDLKETSEFGQVILSTNAMTPLYKVQEVSFRGSNDNSDTPSGASFELIKNKIAIDPTQGTVTIDLGKNFKYRHIRMVCDAYNASGNYMQFSEFVLEKKVD